MSIHGPVQTGDNVVELRGDRETSAAPPSFDDLFLDQHDRLYRALYFITGSSSDAEELMQDAFLKLWERWDRIHEIDDPVAYLFRVAMNGFRMRARRARVAARRVVLLETARDPYDDIELRDDVRRMLLRLPQRQRAALWLRRSSDTARNRPPGSLASGRRPCACSPRRGERRSGRDEEARMPDVRPDIREVYEMVTKQKPADPGGLERQHPRQVRTMRNRKIGAFAVAGAIGVAVLALIFGPGGERAPAPPEPGAQTRATTAEKVARTFVGSLGTFETKEAIDRLADDADISAVVTSLGDEGLQRTPDELPLFASMLSAMDYEQHLVSCDETATSGPATDVRCTFDFHLLGSREFGRSPFSGSSFDLTVQGGEIVEASLHWEVATFSAEMWEPFAEWVSTNHPGDAAVMYEDVTYGAVHLTEGSVQLWDRRVREYVRENASIRPATPLRLSAAAGDVRFSFEIPSPGWGRFGNISINKSIVGPQGAEAIIFWTTLPDGIAEPCTALSGPSGAVAATIATAPGTELDAGPSNVVLGGYPAKYVTVTVREDAGCDPGYFFTWPDVRWGALWPATGVGDTIRVWIVDVGSTRLFIEAETNDQADPDLEREVQQIVGSIRFE